MYRVGTHEKYQSVVVSVLLHMGVCLFLALVGGATGGTGGPATLHLSWGETLAAPESFSPQRIEIEGEDRSEPVAAQVSQDLSEAMLVQPELLEESRSPTGRRLEDATANLTAAVTSSRSKSTAGAGQPLGSGEADGEIAKRGGGNSGAAASGTGGTFFGHTISGERIVFVLDCSGSMNSSSGVKRSAGRDARVRQPPPARRNQWVTYQGNPAYVTRWERLVEELSLALLPLEPKVEFSIILFSEGYLELEGSMQAATPENKAKAIQWVESFQAKNDTYPLPALQHALHHAPEVIYFLTDGDFDATAIRQITWMNERSDSPVKIHTVGLGRIRDHLRLVNLSRYNGGEFIAGR